jgi:hypothetical protein
MSLINKLLYILTSQVKQSNVKLPKVNIPHKIKDDNQSIHNGVIHEKLNISMRSGSKTKA